MNTQRTPPVQTAENAGRSNSNDPSSSRSKRPRPIDSPGKAGDSDNQDEIMSMLTTWKTEQESVLSRLITDVSEIKTEIKQVHKTNTEIEKTLEFVCKNYEDMKLRVENLEKQQEERHKHIEKLEDRVEELERNARSTCLEIRGIPEKPNETKNDLLSIIDNVQSKLKLEVERGFIRNIYRARGKPNGDRPIVMDVTTPIKKYNIFQAVKKYNHHHINDRLNTAAIGLQGKKNPIYFSDFLTPKARRLYFLARDMAKNNGYRFCWCINGKIFMRKAEGSSAIAITSEQQLEDMKQKK